jgi:putative SOS response-associated peptidase YedK
VCNLYSMTKSRQAVREFVRATRDNTENHPPLPAIFPDQMAPVAFTDKTGERVIENMRWGFPPPPNAGPRPVTNIRNTASPYWRPWLKPGFWCLVPVTSFCEYTDSLPKIPTWFGFGADRPLFAFAGIWRPWTGTRKGEEGEHRLFAFLTTEPNAVVRPIHAKAMPVILTGEDCETWLTGTASEALGLQRPFEDGDLSIIASGARDDGQRIPSTVASLKTS